MDEAQRQILKMLKDGTITAGEANRLLAALVDVPVEAPMSAAEDEGAVQTVTGAEDVTGEPDAADTAAGPITGAAGERRAAALPTSSVVHILRQVQAGTLSAEEANALLAAEPVPPGVDFLAPQADMAAAPEPADAFPDEAPAAATGEVLIPEPAPDMDRYRRLWAVPFVIALGFLVVSTLGMAAARGVEGFLGGAGFLCGWSVFMLAALALAAAFWSRTARWVHVRVQERDGKRFAISLPVPFRLVGWAAATARPFVDAEVRQQMDMAVEFLTAMQDEIAQPDAGPLVIDVDDEGEQVQVYLG